MRGMRMEDTTAESCTRMPITMIFGADMERTEEA